MVAVCQSPVNHIHSQRLVERGRRVEHKTDIQGTGERVGRKTIDQDTHVQRSTCNLPSICFPAAAAAAGVIAALAAAAAFEAAAAAWAWAAATAALLDVCWVWKPAALPSCDSVGVDM